MHPHPHPRPLRGPSTARHFSAYSSPHAAPAVHPPLPHPAPSPRAMSASCIPASPSSPSTHMCPRCAPPAPGHSLSAMSPKPNPIPKPPPPPPPSSSSAVASPSPFACRPSFFSRLARRRALGQIESSPLQMGPTRHPTHSKHHHHHHHLCTHHLHQQQQQQQQQQTHPQSPSLSLNRPVRAVYNATTASARAAELAGGHVYDADGHAITHAQQGQGIIGAAGAIGPLHGHQPFGYQPVPRKSQTGSPAGNTSDAKLMHFHQHHHHHHHHLPEDPVGTPHDPDADPDGQRDPISTSSSSSSTSSLTHGAQQQQDVSVTFEKPVVTQQSDENKAQNLIHTTSTSRSPADPRTKRSPTTTRVVVKRRVIRGSPVFRPATEADIDAYLEDERHREMIKCDATSVNIVPTQASSPQPSPSRTPHPHQLQPLHAHPCTTPADLCASCTPAYPAKRSMSSGGGGIGRMRRVPQLFNWGLRGTGGGGGGGIGTGGGNNSIVSTGDDPDSHLIDIAPYAAMDEAKAVAMFLKQVRMYRHDVMTSFQRGGGVDSINCGKPDWGASPTATATRTTTSPGATKQKRNKYNVLSNELFSYNRNAGRQQNQKTPVSFRSFSADDQFAMQASTEIRSGNTTQQQQQQQQCSPPLQQKRFDYAGYGTGIKVISKPGKPAQMRSVSDLHGRISTHDLPLPYPLKGGVEPSSPLKANGKGHSVLEQRCHTDRPHTPPASVGLGLEVKVGPLQEHDDDVNVRRSPLQQQRCSGLPPVYNQVQQQRQRHGPYNQVGKVTYR